MKPADIPAVSRALRREYQKRNAPIVQFQKVREGDTFRILVSTILSARTKDETTAEASERLFRRVRRPRDFDALSQEELERLIFPVGFYRTKARHLKQLPAILDERFGGKIPDTLDGLCSLPGVGRKTASLVLTDAFDKPAICVDVHVHRISNRLGLVSTQTPYETEMALREVLPQRYWKNWNGYLVSFGQTVCTPLRPRCSTCPLARFCPRIGVANPR